MQPDEQTGATVGETFSSHISHSGRDGSSRVEFSSRGDVHRHAAVLDAQVARF